MNQKLQKQLVVQKAVMAVMEINRTKWQSVVELKIKIERFGKNLQKIEAYRAALKTDLVPLKEKRNSSRQKLVEKVFPVTSVLGVYALDIEDQKLWNSVNVKFRELEKMKPDVLIMGSIKVLKNTTKLLDLNIEEGKKIPRHVVADYGLTNSHLDNLRIALDQYIRDESDFRETRMNKKTSKIKYDRRIRENNVLLKKNIDRMMHLFRDNQKTFYNAYIKARITAEAEPVVASKKPVAKKPATAKGSGTDKK